MTETDETLELDVWYDPFPHLIVKNFYNKEELDLIWEELNFYTKPGKLLKDPKNFGAIPGATNSAGIILDQVYRNYEDKKDWAVNGQPNFRPLSNILTVTRKIFDSGIIDVFADIHPCCSIAPISNFDFTKLRYYHDNEYYEPHLDASTHFLAFYYCYKEPKKFKGGNLFFPDQDYEYECDNNSLIIFPGWVQHGVKKVSIKNSNYHDGYGRYSITTFFGSRYKPQ